MESHRRISRGYSLIFDMEIEENGEPPSFEVRPNINKIKERFFTPDTKDEQQLVDQCLLISQDINQNDQNWINMEAFCKALQNKGQKAWMRTSYLDKNKQEPIHKYIIVSLNDQEYMVDPNYRREFSLGNEEPWFTKLVNGLPPVLVAVFDLAIMLLEVLIEEMQMQFFSSGSSIPPWREQNLMLARWKSEHYEDSNDSSQKNEGNTTSTTCFTPFTPKLCKDYNYENNADGKVVPSALTQERLATIESQEYS